MITKSYAYALMVSSLAMLLAGCGGGGGTTASGNANTLHESTACIGCHDSISWTTPGSRKPLVAEWKNSTHMTANGASCSDCHDDGYMHPVSCTRCHNVGAQARNPSNNPDQDGKCAKCHARINPLTGNPYGFTTPVVALGVPAGSTTSFTHFSTGKRVNYVSSYNRLHCRNCHNPHDTSFGAEQRKQWSESAHGNTRGLGRTQLDAKTRGSRIPLNQNFGNGNYCIRCHTSTGFINFVAGDLFTDIRALADIGADGLPDPDGFRSNYPDYKIVSNVPYAASDTGNKNPLPYRDTSREATGCNVCHLDIRTSGTSSYGGSLRNVAVEKGVRIYYPYSSSGTGHSQSITTVQFVSLGNSNLCLACHSGRATGQTIKANDTVYRNNLTLDFTKNPAAPSVHDFAGGAVLEGEKTAFLFYTSPLKYKTYPAHRAINTDGNGPCISCHMPKVQSGKSDSQIHLHLFRPVSWVEDDLNQDITEIISNPTVCSRCHNDAFQPSLNPTKMNQLRKGFRVSLLILAALRPSSNNWTGKNTNGGLSITYGNTQVPVLGSLPAGAYTMGASFNYGFFFNEPSSYNHSPILARQLIYDSIDWLKNGAAGFGTSPASVYSAIKNVPIPTGNATANPPVPPGFLWTKVNTVLGEQLGTSSNKNYGIYATEADREEAFKFLCKDYISGSNLCNRW